MTAAFALDQSTAEAIRRAVSAAGAGRLPEACAIGEQALAAGGDVVALNAMLGMFRCRAGEFDAALRHLRPAHRARPADTSIAANLIAALVECGELHEAMALASPELAKADASLRIARYRGHVAQLLGDVPAALEAHEAVAAAAPQDWQSWNNLGNARLLAGDSDGAIAAIRRSAELNPEATPIRLNLARALAKSGRPGEAEAQLRAAAERFPNDAQPLLELHDLLRRRGRPETELLELLESAAEREPDNRRLLLALGRQLMIAGQMDRAETALRSVLDADPSDGEAFLELAKLYEHSQPDALEALAAEAERDSLKPPALDVVRAFAHRRAKRYAEGLAELRDVDSAFEPWLVEELRGQFHDKLGEHDLAFAAFTRMNEAQAADPSEPLARASRLRERMRRQLDELAADWIAGWKAPPLASEGPDPVFLVGFPRSGTTLLDTMLMGHPDVAVLEERLVLDQVERAIGGFDAIPELDEAAVYNARARYFKAASRFAPIAERRLLIDKSPLYLAKVPLIHRLFPAARFILAVRHPADVILSCYFSNFRISSAMSNFLRLDTAAEYYDLVFRTWEKALSLIPMDVHRVTYENLVDEPEAELRSVAEALGLDWSADMLDHRRTAASRGMIPTVSYAQVTEPIYRSSAGRWRNYATHLEPVLPVIRPWAEKFGYEL